MHKSSDLLQGRFAWPVVIFSAKANVRRIYLLNSRLDVFGVCSAHPYGLLAGLATPGVSTLVTLITYVIVTVEPGLSSADPLIVAGSIANSYFSVPFSTESVVPVAATTVPVISYVFPPAANNGAANTRLIPVSK